MRNRPKRIFFVGLGSSYYAAKLSEYLCREYTFIPAFAIQSSDFVRSKYQLDDNDIVTIFSHRGTKTFSISALELANRIGATSIFVTGMGSPNHRCDFRIETCPQEDCHSLTISLTSAVTKIIQWLGSYNKMLLQRFCETTKLIRIPIRVPLPMFLDNLVIMGDLIREVVAREVSLKICEASFLPVRSFGIEEFLHGPRVSINKESRIVAFTYLSDARRKSLSDYIEVIGSELILVDEEQFTIPPEFRWLAQLLWGQCLALEISKRLGTNPDLLRSDEPLYQKARSHLIL